MPLIAPDILESAQQPLRQAVRRLRWFKASFRAQVGVIAQESGVDFTIDSERLVETFLEWIRAFEAQKPKSEKARHDYVGFASGLMLRQMIKSNPLSVQSLPKDCDETNPAYFWPEGYVYVAYCLNVRGAILDQDFNENRHLSPSIEDLRTWWSFKENVGENASLAISFLDLFAGETPDWNFPSVFYKASEPTVKLPRYPARKTVTTVATGKERSVKTQFLHLAAAAQDQQKCLPRETRLVLLDLDGVVANGETLALDELCQIINEYGVAISHEDTRNRFMGRPTAAPMTFIAEKTGQICPNHFVDELEGRVLKRFNNELSLIPGFEPFLDSLESRNLEYCITSGSPAHRLESAMTLLGLKQRFPHRYFSAENVAEGKPAPDLFLHAASEIGVLPQNCVVIEASAAGMQGAATAKMFPIGFVGNSHIANVLASQRKLLRQQGAQFCLNAFSEVSFPD